MKYLYSWLKELSPTVPALEDIESALIQLGHDVADISPITYEGLVVAEITEVMKHPNADTLSLTKVNDGTTTHNVVCGAPDLKVGQKAIFAPIGTVLPCGLTIRKAKIRGESSEGMLCAEDELGIGTSHASLYPLPDNAEVGAPAANYLPADAVIDLDITPNRGDILSHFGLARDLHALTGSSVLTPKFKKPRYSGATSGKVELADIHSDTLHFSLGYAEAEPGQRISTPLWMTSRLTLLGLKSINLPTDITNYLLLEYGQPLHAYDTAKLAPISMGTRRAHADEQFVGLDDRTYSLSPQSLVITNQDTPIAIAGVLGGRSTKTEGSTHSVLFECAAFNPRAITLAARGLGLLTDSAIRFERGVDPEIHTPVLEHALALWQELTNGTVYEPFIGKEEASTEARVVLKLHATNAFLGKSVQQSEILRIASALGCTTSDLGEEIHISAPSWRFDLRYPEDYYEEIARIIGLQTFPKTPLSASVPQWKRSLYWRTEALKDLLAAVGAYEIRTYPFAHESEVNRPESALKLKNPPIEDKPFLRTALTPSMLGAIAANPETPQTILFEIAAVYTDTEEPTHLCLSVSGGQEQTIFQWWQNLFERLRLPVSSWMSRVKTIDEETATRYKIRKPIVTVLELPLDDIITKSHEIPNVLIPTLEDIHYTPLSRYQASRRDIAVVVSKTYAAQDIADTIKSVSPLVKDVELFDVYTNAEKLGADMQSVAFRVLYQAPDRTLTTEEINALHAEVEQTVQEKYNGSIR